MKTYRVMRFWPALLLILGGCSGSEYRDIRNFYFPLKELNDGLVYEYKGVNPTLAPVFWYNRSIVQNGEVYLAATYYEDDLLPLQHQRERMTPSGMELEAMYLYEQDTSGSDRQLQTEVEILEGDLFPFQVRDSGGIFLYHVRWRDALQPSATFSVIKNRYYAGDTTFVLEGKTYPAVRFTLKELFVMDQDGVLEQGYSSEEVYAKGLGLVYFKKSIAEGVDLEYRLARRYPMTELEDKFRERYDIPLPEK